MMKMIEIDLDTLPSIILIERDALGFVLADCNVDAPLRSRLSWSSYTVMRILYRNELDASVLEKC